MTQSKHTKLMAGIGLSVIPTSIGYLAWYLAGLRADFGTGFLFGLLTLFGPLIGIAALLAISRHSTRIVRFGTCVATLIIQYYFIFGLLPPPFDFYGYGLRRTVRRELPVDEFRSWAYEQAKLATNDYFRIQGEEAPAFLKKGVIAADYDIRGIVHIDGSKTNVTMMWNTIGITVGPIQASNNEKIMLAEDVQFFVAVRK